jgi:hypothetical protein
MIGNILYFFVLIYILGLYFKMLTEHIAEKRLYKAMRSVYLKENEFLFLSDNGNLLTLTSKNNCTTSRVHYFTNSNMIIENPLTEKK